MLENCYTPGTVVRFVLHVPLSMQCYSEMAATDSAPKFELVFYLKALLLTLILEAPFYRWCLEGRSAKAFLTALVLCNLATHPMVFYGFPALATTWQIPTYINLLVSEIFAPSVEAILLLIVWGVRPWKASASMFAANFFSWWMGGILWAQF